MHHNECKPQFRVISVVNSLLYLEDWLRTLREVHIVNIGLVEKVSEWLFLERTNLEGFGANGYQGLFTRLQLLYCGHNYRQHFEGL